MKIHTAEAGAAYCSRLIGRQASGVAPTTSVEEQRPRDDAHVRKLAHNAILRSRRVRGVPYPLR